MIVLASGEGRAEDLGESWRMANALGAQGIPNRVDPWGPEHALDLTRRDRVHTQRVDPARAVGTFAVAREEAVRRCGETIPALGGIDHQHVTARASCSAAPPPESR